MYSMRRFAERGIAVDHYVMGFNCHVDDGRNAILRDFLKTDCTDLIFIDADVTWEPEALVKLALYDRDIVAGVYPKRSPDDDSYPVRVDPGTALHPDSDGLVEVIGAPTGFMKIKRHVIEKFTEANKHRQFVGMGASADDAPHTIIFERTYVDGHRWSGDYNFCREWRNMGGKIFVDPEMHLSHIGEVEFSGTLGDYWRKKHGVLKLERERAFRQAIGALRSGNPTAQTWVDLVAGWDNPFAADVELLAACYELAKASSGPFLETGTGLSTLVLALANPAAQIHSLEHDPIWGNFAQGHLDRLGIKNVTIHCRPLIEYPGGVDWEGSGNELSAGRWYDTTGLPKGDFSLALSDGPPRTESNRAIFFEQLAGRIRRAVVLLDDACSDSAVAPMRRWAGGNTRNVSVLGERRRFAVSVPNWMGGENVAAS